MNDPSWPAEPYKGLAYYAPEDTALFIGREADILDCADLVTDAKTRVLLLQGPTGCGKSSFLRAGLIPFLELQVPIFQFLRNFDSSQTKALFIQSYDEPLRRLCEALYDWAGRPFALDVAPGEPPRHIDLKTIRADAPDRATFANKMEASADRLIEIMTQIDMFLPKTMIFVIDQLEEICTLKPGPEGDRSRDLFFEFLHKFNESSTTIKLIVAFRKEYFSDLFYVMKKRNYDPSRFDLFHLRQLNRDELVKTIIFPTRHDVEDRFLGGRRRQPREFYKFSFEAKIAEKIVDDVLESKNQESREANIQIRCKRIYDHRNPAGRRSRFQSQCPRCKEIYDYGNRARQPSTVEWKITESDYIWSGDPDRQVGLYLDEKIDEGIARCFAHRYQNEHDREQASWKELLHSFRITAPRGETLTDTVPVSELRARAHDLGCKGDFSKMTQHLAAEDQRILREDRRTVAEARGEHEPSISYYSLGHDALTLELRKWQEDERTFMEKRNYLDEKIKQISVAAGKVLWGVGFIVLVVVLGRGIGAWIWWLVAALLIAGSMLSLAPTRVAKSLTQRIADTDFFRSLTDTGRKRAETREAIRQLQNSLTAGRAPQPSANEREALKGAEQALRAKPEKDYTAADWARRAFAAYADAKLDLAAEYFGQAATAAAAGGSQTQRAEYLFNRGFLFGELQRAEEALAAYDELLAQFKDTAEPRLRELVAKTLRNKGVNLGRLQRSEDELASYEELLARFTDATEPTLREQVAVALLNKGVRLGRLQPPRTEEELAAYDELLARFEDATEPVLREQVAKALLNKGITLGQLQPPRTEEELAAYNELLARFEDATEPVLREVVAMALLNKGVWLGRLPPPRSAEAVVAYDALLARFEDATEPVLREQVAKSLFNKGVTLGQLQRSEEELAAYNELLARFEDATEPVLREHVAKGLLCKGTALGRLQRRDEERAAYDLLIARFGDAAEPGLRDQVEEARRLRAEDASVAAANPAADG